MSDEILDELRAIRTAHSDRFKGDVRAMFADLRRNQAQLIAEGVEIIKAPAECPAPREFSVQKIRFAGHK